MSGDRAFRQQRRNLSLYYAILVRRVLPGFHLRQNIRHDSCLLDNRVFLPPVFGIRPLGDGGGEAMGAERLRVLCVDDNHDIADSEVDLLDIYGFDARACYDGPCALVVGREFSPSVYLIDLNMPGMDGCEVARELRAEYDGLPMLVAVTARSSTDDFRRTKEAGFDAHLVKPVDPQRLLEMLSTRSRQ